MRRTIATLAVFVLGVLVITSRGTSLRTLAETEADAAACQLPAGSQGPGLCTGFNEASGAQTAAMIDHYNDQWDVRAATVARDGIPQPTSMHSGCNAVGHLTLTDADRMALLCGWHMMSAVDSGGIIAAVTMRPRSSIDLSGGQTRRIVWTMDAAFSNRQWVDVWLTDQPLRYPNFDDIANTCETDCIQNGVGIGFRHVQFYDRWVPGRTPAVSYHPQTSVRTQDNARNRFVWEVSKTHFRLTMDGQEIAAGPFSPPLPFDAGYLNWHHAEYNHVKDCVPGDPIHDMDCALDTVHWDNMGFDGPVQQFRVGSTRASVNYDVPSGGTRALTVQHPTGGQCALFFSAYASGTSGSVRVNGGPWHSFVGGGDWWKTQHFPGETCAAGPNTVEFRASGGGYPVNRIDLEVQAGGQPSTPTTTPTSTSTVTPPATPAVTPTSTSTPTATSTMPPTVQPTPTPTPTRCRAYQVRQGSSWVWVEGALVTEPGGERRCKVGG